VVLLRAFGWQNVRLIIALCHGCNRDFPSDQCARSAETRFTVTSVIRPQEWIVQSLQDRGEDVEGPELSGAVPLTPPFRL
jgi:hypothetical protein